MMAQIKKGSSGTECQQNDGVWHKVVVNYFLMAIRLHFAMRSRRGPKEHDSFAIELD